MVAQEPPESPRRRNPRGEGTRLRGEIVAAASALLVETGDAGAVTLRAVSRRAGISAPAIYAHFANVDQILLAVVAGQFDLLQQRLDAAVAVHEEPVDRLRAWATAYLDQAAEQPQHYQVMLGGVWVAAGAVADGRVVDADLAELGRVLLARLAMLLDACARSGDSRSTDPDGDAVTLWVGLHGLAQQRIVSPALTWPDDVDARLLERLALLGTSS